MLQILLSERHKASIHKAQIRFFSDECFYVVLNRVLFCASFLAVYQPTEALAPKQKSDDYGNQSMLLEVLQMWRYGNTF